MVSGVTALPRMQVQSKFMACVEDGIESIKNGGAVASGDELMTIVNLLIDTGLGETVASDLYAAAISGGVVPSLPAPLTSVLEKIAVALGVDATGLSSGDPEKVIKVVLALRKKTSSLTALADAFVLKAFERF